MFSRRRFLIALAVVVLLSAVGSGLLIRTAWRAHHASGPLEESRNVTILPGMGLDAISSMLQHNSVIEDSFRFRLIARLQELDDLLRAGEYRFQPGISAAQVLKMLQKGDTYLHRLTVSEGLTSQQILALLRRTKTLSGATPEFLAEASIMPETYHFEKGLARQTLLGIMNQAWISAVEPLWQARRNDYPLDSLEEVLILASIVEKEAMREEEMPLIAGVFLNRLRRGIPLQSDPTVIYALTNGTGELGRRLRRKDWKLEHQHNTYYRKGLPPTAIAHPGLAAVMATLSPKESDSLFFVADGKGGHRFSTTLKEHNANVAKLKALRKK